MARPFRIADIACGAGMASRGVIDELNRRGFAVEVVAAVDPWGPACASYDLNVPEAKGRVYQTTAESALASGLVPTADLVVGGPPCIRDSRLMRGGGHTKELRESRVDETAQIKAAFRQIACIAPMSAMETVGKRWAGYEGGHTVTLRDSELGGFTIRQRTLITWGMGHMPAKTYPSPGWGAALPRYGRYPYVLVHDATSAKRRADPAFWRVPSRPAQSVTGGGATHIVLDSRTGKKVHRCTPAEEAALSGFPGLVLASPRVRERQTLVGNGWPRSFGAWVGASVAETLRRRR